MPSSNSKKRSYNSSAPVAQWPERHPQSRLQVAGSNPAWRIWYSMDKEEHKKFKDALREWCNKSKDNFCSESISYLSDAHETLCDTVNTLRCLLDGLDGFNEGTAKLMHDDFRFLTDDQSQQLFKNKTTFEQFRNSAEGMIQLMESLLDDLEEKE